MVRGQERVVSSERDKRNLHLDVLPPLPTTAPTEVLHSISTFVPIDQAICAFKRALETTYDHLCSSLVAERDE